MLLTCIYPCGNDLSLSLSLSLARALSSLNTGPETGVYHTVLDRKAPSVVMTTGFKHKRPDNTPGPTTAVWVEAPAGPSAVMTGRANEPKQEDLPGPTTAYFKDPAIRGPAAVLTGKPKEKREENQPGPTTAYFEDSATRGPAAVLTGKPKERKMEDHPGPTTAYFKEPAARGPSATINSRPRDPKPDAAPGPGAPTVGAAAEHRGPSAVITGGFAQKTAEQYTGPGPGVWCSVVYMTEPCTRRCISPPSPPCA
jgi:hypothetical protein